MKNEKTLIKILLYEYQISQLELQPPSLIIFEIFLKHNKGVQIFL